MNRTRKIDTEWEALANDDHIYASSAFRREAIARHRPFIEAAILAPAWTAYPISTEAGKKLNNALGGGWSDYIVAIEMEMEARFKGVGYEIDEPEVPSGGPD